jgi:formylglycine-generating enzyme required for sulfatase activity
MLKYPWGQEMPPPEDAGNFADQAAKEIVPTVLPRYNDGFASTAPVGTFPANALGLYDTGGNVAEWTNDYYGVYTGPADDVAVDPLGPDDGTHRVIRGSSWQHSGITQLRLSYRDFGTDPRTDVGFRLVRNAPE